MSEGYVYFYTDNPFSTILNSWPRLQCKESYFRGESIFCTAVYCL